MSGRHAALLRGEIPEPVTYNISPNIGPIEVHIPDATPASAQAAGEQIAEIVNKRTAEFYHSIDIRRGIRRF